VPSDPPEPESERESEHDEWSYSPAADLGASWRERLQGFPREPHLWMYLARGLVALALRAWLRTYHRLEVRGRERLPLGRAFVIVANHQSHLDAPTLISAMPLRQLHRTFPAAAADYFFKSFRRSLLSSVIVNGLPFERESGGADSLAICRELLESGANILILFPEGTRATSGELGRFRSGIGRLLEGTAVPVVPCHLEGAWRAFPKGSPFPRPAKLILRIGEPRSYGHLPPGRPTVEHIADDLREAVRRLAPGSTGSSPVGPRDE